MKNAIRKAKLRMIDLLNWKYNALPVDERSPSHLQPIINLRLYVWVKGP